MPWCLILRANQVPRQQQETGRQMLRKLLLFVLVAHNAKRVFADDPSDSCASQPRPGNVASGSSLMQTRSSSRRIVMADMVEERDLDDGAPPPLFVEPFYVSAQTMKSEGVMMEQTESHSQAGELLPLLLANDSAAAALIGGEVDSMKVQHPTAFGNASSLGSNASASISNYLERVFRRFTSTAPLLLSVRATFDSVHARASQLAKTNRGDGGLGSGVVITLAMVLVLLGLMVVLLMQPDASSSAANLVLDVS